MLTVLTAQLDVGGQRGVFQILTVPGMVHDVVGPQHRADGRVASSVPEASTMAVVMAAGRQLNTANVVLLFKIGV